MTSPYKWTSCLVFTITKVITENENCVGNAMVISATSKSGIWLSQDVAKSKAGFENRLVTWIFAMHVKAKEKSNYGIVHKKWWTSIVWFS